MVSHKNTLYFTPLLLENAGFMTPHFLHVRAATLQAPINAGGTFALRFGGSGTDEATAIESDATTGASYVAGRFQSRITAGAFSELSYGGSDGFALRVDNTGTVTWLKKYVSSPGILQWRLGHNDVRGEYLTRISFHNRHMRDLFVLSLT